MSKIQFLSGKRDEMTTLAGGLVIAVDIGFAKDNGKSCGVAWKSAVQEITDVMALDFRPALVKVCELLKSERIGTLIIEAPLSALFSAAGNPIKRGDFEELRIDGKTKQRYWYHKGGATPCLASIHFLRHIRHHLSTIENSSRIIVHLYEGFISFKSGRTSHKADAKRLLNCFMQPKPSEMIVIEPEKGQLAVALIDLVTNSHGSPDMPLILKPQ